MKKIIATLCLFVSLFSAYQIITAQNSSKIYSVSELEQLAKNKDADAQLQLGMRYLTGDGVLPDTKEAEKWLKKAAEQKNLEAIYQLGLMYFKGTKDKPDLKKAFKMFEKAAELNYPQAMLKLGECYIYGYGEKQDLWKGFELVKRAANEGLPTAQMFYAYCLENGEGVAQDISEAKQWYEKAADKGLPLVQYRLGAIYDEGQSVERNPHEAEKWFLEAAKQPDPEMKLLMEESPLSTLSIVSDLEKSSAAGDPTALNQMGNLYYYGIFKQVDKQGAIAMLRKAADAGSLSAQAKLGSYYLFGKLAISENDLVSVNDTTFNLNSDAKKWLTMAAANGDKYSKLVLLYDKIGNDKGLTADELHFLKTIGDSGHLLTQVELASYYLNQTESAAEFKEGVKWLTKAAENGDIEAQSYLGYLYLMHNPYIEYNEAEGLKWSEKASQNGSAFSTFQLIQYYFEHDMFDKAFQYAKIFKQQTGEDYKPMLQYNIGMKCYDIKNFTEAFHYFKEASLDGNVDALFMQGYCYFTGQGTDLNYKEAVNLWQRGAENENIPSLYYLGLCYELGKGVGKDTEKSDELFFQAADLYEECDTMGVVAEVVEVVNWDEEEGEDYEEVEVEEVAYPYEIGVAAADTVVSVEEEIYVYNPGGILWKLNYEPAINGDAVAQYNIGNFYYYGIGVEGSDEEATEWYSKAVAQGFTPAKDKLAMIKFDLGLDQLEDGNKAEAFKYFKEAAAQGCLPAKAYLGACYLYGYGVKKNKTEGLNLIKSAADAGCAEGENLLGVYYYYQSNVGSEEEDVDEALLERAKRLFKSAASKGDTAAKFNYGFTIIWDDDPDTGKDLIIEAAKEGDIAAEIWIGNDYWASEYGFTESEIEEYGDQYDYDDWEMLYEKYHHVFVEYH